MNRTTRNYERQSKCHPDPVQSQKADNEANSSHLPWAKQSALSLPSLSPIPSTNHISGIFPNDFKIAIILPLHKSDSKLICDNYRPISVLSCIAKIFEKLISGQLNTYLESNGLLIEQQSGFWRKNSTQTSLLRTKNQWL